jgi:hypothetical protein
MGFGTKFLLKFFTIWTSYHMLVLVWLFVEQLCEDGQGVIKMGNFSNNAT